jgi:hypothetical protein
MESTSILALLTRLTNEQAKTCFELNLENLQSFIEANAELYLLETTANQIKPSPEPAAWCMLLKCSEQESAGQSWHLQCYHYSVPNPSEFAENSRKNNLNWGNDQDLTQDLRTHVANALATESIDQDLSELVCRSLVVFQRTRRNIHEVAVACLMEGFGLVASLLAKAGPPPAVVIQDWQDQLAAFSFSSKNKQAPTACTFLDPDGVLIPLFYAMQIWAERHSMVPSVWSPTEDASSHRIAWPWAARISPTATPLISIDSFQRKPSKPSRPPRVALLALSVIAILGIGTMVAVFSSSGPKPPQPRELAVSSEQTSRVQPQNRPPENRPPEPATQTELASLPATESPELTTIEGIDAITSPNQELPSTEAADSLLAQLQPNQSSDFSLATLDSKAVISDALGLSNKKMSAEPAGDVSSEAPLVESPTDSLPLLSDDSQSPAEEPVEVTPAEKDVSTSLDGTLAIDQTFVVDTSRKKMATVVGKSVLPKQCRTEIEIKLAKDFVVEPSQSVTIEGEGEATWRIALEDEEPELVLVISSKPGGKWQTAFTLGLRMDTQSPPMLFAPRDAQTVGNRLVQFIQWIDTTILQLEAAKAASRGRSPIDYYGEIKKLNKERRVAEKAIEQWKVIERLSHLFFDDNQVAMKLHAVLK